LSGYRAHLAAGGIVCLLLFYLTKIDFSIELVVVCLFYSLLPDFDSNMSKINNILEKVGLFLIFFICLGIYLDKVVFSNLLFAVFISGVLLVSKFLKHRRQFHTVSVGFVLSLPMAFVFGVEGFLFAFAGWFSHLLLDGEVVK